MQMIIVFLCIMTLNKITKRPLSFRNIHFRPGQDCTYVEKGACGLRVTNINCPWGLRETVFLNGIHALQHPKSFFFTEGLCYLVIFSTREAEILDFFFSACCQTVISFFPLCEVRCARVPNASFSPWESANKWQLFSLSGCFKDPWLAPQVTTVKEDQMTFSLLLNTDVTKLESIHFDFMCPSLSKTNKTLCSAR